MLIDTQHLHPGTGVVEQANTQDLYKDLDQIQGLTWFRQGRGPFPSARLRQTAFIWTWLHLKALSLTWTCPRETGNFKAQPGMRLHKKRKIRCVNCASPHTLLIDANHMPALPSGQKTRWKLRIKRTSNWLSRPAALSWGAWRYCCSLPQEKQCMAC